MSKVLFCHCYIIYLYSLLFTRFIRFPSRVAVVTCAHSPISLLSLDEHDRELAIKAMPQVEVESALSRVSDCFNLNFNELTKMEDATIPLCSRLSLVLAVVASSLEDEPERLKHIGQYGFKSLQLLNGRVRVRGREAALREGAEGDGAP